MEKYVTKAVKEKLPMHSLIEIWNMIEDGFEYKPLDYLLVFEVYQHPCGTMMIKMSQEEPQATKIQKSISPFPFKVWVMLGPNCTTILFPEDY